MTTIIIALRLKKKKQKEKGILSSFLMVNLKSLIKMQQQGLKDNFTRFSC